VFSPTSVYTENNYPHHRPSLPLLVFSPTSVYAKKTQSAPPPLLVFSPTRVYTENKIRTTALVGVFTNKIILEIEEYVHPPPQRPRRNAILFVQTIGGE